MAVSDQLLAAIVGGAIGVTGTLIGTWFKDWLSTTRQRKKVASLLLSEIKANESYLRWVEGIAERISETGVLHSEDEELTRHLKKTDEYIDGPQTHAEGFTSTLQHQGLLKETTLKSLHRFYRHLKEAEARISAAEKQTNEAVLVKHIEKAEKQAKLATKEVESKNLKEKLRQEKSWLPFRRP